jgi:hypothetical protein
MLRYIYRIDKTDQIEFVNSEWLEFARENGSPELAHSSILGSSIWDHIAGTETRLLYESMFSRLRAKNNEVIIPFHCDSPTMIRKMVLTLRSISHGGIQMEGSVLELRERAYTPILDPGVSRNKEEVVICSLCRRILVADGEWKTIESAVVRLRLLARSSAPRLIESVCPQCRDQVSKSDSLM